MSEKCCTTNVSQHAHDSFVLCLSLAFAIFLCFPSTLFLRPFLFLVRLHCYSCYKTILCSIIPFPPLSVTCVACMRAKSNESFTSLLLVLFSRIQRPKTVPSYVRHGKRNGKKIAGICATTALPAKEGICPGVLPICLRKRWTNGLELQNFANSQSNRCGKSPEMSKLWN